MVAVSVSGRSLYRESTRKRKLLAARRIVQSLRAEGDRFFHRHEVLRSPEAIERWRDSIGRHMNRSPFKPGTGDEVLTQDGDRFSDPLQRLRRIETDVERYIED
ncbi:MAG TPA: hypothetical protein VEV39_05695 [Gemmatimonadales bacterium]|nr:hypothetical protein [Gemmatimonadales bacterium]